MLSLVSLPMLLCVVCCLSCCCICWLVDACMASELIGLHPILSIVGLSRLEVELLLLELDVLLVLELEVLWELEALLILQLEVLALKAECQIFWCVVF